MKHRSARLFGAILGTGTSITAASAQQAFPVHPDCANPIGGFAEAGAILDGLAQRPFVDGASILVANRDGVILYEQIK